MYSELRRHGDLGVIVYFRLESTEEFLWKAPMQMLPAKNDLVGHLHNEDDVEDWYKVEGIRFEFDHDYEPYIGPGGGSVPYVAEHENFGVVVFVSLVL